MVDIQAVQRWRKLFILVGLVALLGWTPLVRAVPVFEHAVEHLGLIAIMICIIGRAWCSLYIGGRKKAEIVDTGPYSISRNPLYVFSYIGAFGVGAQTGSVSMGLLFLAVTMTVFHFTVAREEAWLLNAFGEPYEAYMRRTPRFGPDFSKWKEEPVLQVRPQFFLETIRDGLVLLLAIPVFEAIEKLQEMGVLRTLLHLP